VPQIIAGIVGAFRDLAWQVVQIGGDLIKGIWQGNPVVFKPDKRENDNRLCTKHCRQICYTRQDPVSDSFSGKQLFAA